MKNILKDRKDEIINNMGDDSLKQLKKLKFLTLIESEIKEMLDYWVLGQILQMINKEFNLSIRKTVFYNFCSKNKLKAINKDKEIDISQNRDVNNEKVHSLQNQLSKSSEKEQLQIAKTTELKDDGQLKVADKSEFN